MPLKTSPRGLSFPALVGEQKDNNREQPDDAGHDRDHDD
jgi:hypothetical protein